MSDNATIATVDAMGKQRIVPIQSWMEKGMEFKFVSDNVDKKGGSVTYERDVMGK